LLFETETPFCDWQLHGLYQAPAILFDDISSTHTYLHEHYQMFAPGTLVVSNSQSEGRGRHKRSWFSPKNKNLYFNLLVSLENVFPQHYSQITQIAAIELAKILLEYGLEVAVKWPNDLLFQKQKICGVLSEVISKGDQKLLSLGMGVNANADLEDFNALQKPATSLKIIFGKPINRLFLLQKFISNFEVAMLKLQKEGFLPWKKDWMGMENFLGETAHIIEGTKRIEGRIRGVNNNGSLLFQKSSGELITIISGDLEI